MEAIAWPARRARCPCPRSVSTGRRASRCTASCTRAPAGDPRGAAASRSAVAFHPDPGGGAGEFTQHRARRVAQLTDEGYLEGRVGAGTTVRGALPDALLHARPGVAPLARALTLSERKWSTSGKRRRPGRPLGDDCIDLRAAQRGLSIISPRPLRRVSRPRGRLPRGAGRRPATGARTRRPPHPAPPPSPWFLGPPAARAPRHRRCIGARLMALVSSPPCYERHRPEDTVLYRTLEGHLEAFLARAADQGGGDGLPTLCHPANSAPTCAVAASSARLRACPVRAVRR